MAKVCDGIEELASRAGKSKKLETIHLPSPTIYKYIEVSSFPSYHIQGLVVSLSFVSKIWGVRQG